MANQTLNDLIEDIGIEAAERILEVYKNECKKQFTNIADYIEKLHFDKLECESHAMKSASYSFGFDDVGDAMSVIENAAINNEINIAARALQHARIAYEQALSDLVI